jgi:hypothetical protein
VLRADLRIYDGVEGGGGVQCRVDPKRRFQFFAKYDERFQLDVIIAIIATFVVEVPPSSAAPREHPRLRDELQLYQGEP